MRLGEADRIITLYTPDRGKVRAVVKGARRAKSRKGGFLQPLTHVRVSIAEGRSLDQVVEAETVASFRAVREDLGLVSTGLYLAELVDGFSADGAVNPSEFHLLAAALGALESTERPEQLPGTSRRECWASPGSALRCNSAWTAGRSLRPATTCFRAPLAD